MKTHRCARCGEKIDPYVGVCQEDHDVCENVDHGAAALIDAVESHEQDDDDDG